MGKIKLIQEHWRERDFGDEILLTCDYIGGGYLIKFEKQEYIEI